MGRLRPGALEQTGTTDPLRPRRVVRARRGPCSELQARTRRRGEEVGDDTVLGWEGGAYGCIMLCRCVPVAVHAGVSVFMIRHWAASRG